MMKIALLCSWGGHMQEMMDLRDAWGKYDYCFYTYTSDRSKALDEPKVLIYPSWKSGAKYLFTLAKAMVHITFNKPDVLLSTGMGWVDIFMFPYCRLLGVKTIYIESAANVNYISGTANFIRPFCDRFFVQWEELASKIGAEYMGGVL
jgi:hypothetical protein